MTAKQKKELTLNRIRLDEAIENATKDKRGVKTWYDLKYAPELDEGPRLLIKREIIEKLTKIPRKEIEVNGQDGQHDLEEEGLVINLTKEVSAEEIEINIETTDQGTEDDDDAWTTKSNHSVYHLAFFLFNLDVEAWLKISGVYCW